MPRVKVYSTSHCPICQKTKVLLAKWGIPYQEIRIDQDRQLLREFLMVTDNARSVPQICIDDNWIGGFTEMTEYHMDGKLDELMETS